MPQSRSQQCPTKLLVDVLQAGAARAEHAMRELHELKRTNHSLLSDCEGLAGQLAEVSGRACLCCQELFGRPVSRLRRVSRGTGVKKNEVLREKPSHCRRVRHCF